MRQGFNIKIMINALIIFSATFYIGAYFFGILLFAFMLFQEKKKMKQVLMSNKALLGWMLSLILCTLFSRTIGVSLLMDLVIAAHLMIYMVMLIWVNKENIDYICKLLNILGIAVSAYGLYQYFTGALLINASWTDQDTYGILVRIYSSLRNPNIFAAYLTFNISYAAASLFKKKIDPWVGLNIVFSSICLILTYSRGGFLAFVAAVSIIAIFSRDRRAYLYLGFMLLLYMGFNMLENTNRADLRILTDDSSSLYRMEIWRASWELFKANIFLGSGPGSVAKLLSYSSATLKGYVTHAHSIPLQILAETGLVGFTSFSAAIFTAYKWCLRYWQQHREDQYAFAALGFAAVLTSMLVHGMVDCAVLVPSRSIIFLIYLSLFPALYIKERISKDSTLFKTQGFGNLFNSKGSGYDQGSRVS